MTCTDIISNFGTELPCASIKPFTFTSKNTTLLHCVCAAIAHRITRAAAESLQPASHRTSSDQTTQQLALLTRRLANAACVLIFSSPSCFSPFPLLLLPVTRSTCPSLPWECVDLLDSFRTHFCTPWNIRILCVCLRCWLIALGHCFEQRAGASFFYALTHISAHRHTRSTWASRCWPECGVAAESNSPFGTFKILNFSKILISMNF